MFKLSCSLALTDLWHDRKVTLCVVAALVAIMAPLLLLFGLKHGVITQLRHDLAQKPDLLEIRTQGNTHRLTLPWLDSVKQREDVSFAIGLTRSLNAEAQVFKTEQAAQHSISDHLYSEIIPTAEGDPLFSSFASPITKNDIAISHKLAQQLKFAVGDPLFFKLSRTTNGQKINTVFSAHIAYILPPQLFSRSAAFVPVEFLLGMEYFIDGLQDSFEVVERVPEHYIFANVRIYARSMQDVLGLSEWLEQQHIQTSSQQSAIHSTLTINAVLNLIFSVIAITALVGGLTSLTGSFLANIDRRHQLIAILRLLGFNKKNIISYISIQIFIITILSYCVSVAFYFAGSSVFNHFLGKNEQTSSFSTYLSLNQLLIAFLLSVLVSLVVAAIGAKQSMHIEPAESLRAL